MHHFSRARVKETQFPRMQHLARMGAGQAPCVEGIAKQRMIEVLEMHPDLMGASGVQVHITTVPTPGSSWMTCHEVLAVLPPRSRTAIFLRCTGCRPMELEIVPERSPEKNPCTSAR